MQNLNNIQSLIVNAAIAKVEANATNLVTERLAETIERHLAATLAEGPVREGIRARIESVDLSERVDAALSGAMAERVAAEGAAIRDHMMEKMTSEQLDHDSLTASLWNNGERRIIMLEYMSEYIVGRYFSEGSTRLMGLIDRAQDAVVERVVERLTSNTSTSRRIEDRIVSAVSEALLERLDGSVAAASSVPEVAEPIRDDAEALADRLVSGAPF